MQYDKLATVQYEYTRMLKSSFTYNKSSYKVEYAIQSLHVFLPPSTRAPLDVMARLPAVTSCPAPVDSMRATRVADVFGNKARALCQSCSHLQKHLTQFLVVVRSPAQR
jgi:hypothetical protein